MAEPQPFAPVAMHERIAAMDVLRGFALLGILLMNIEAMAGPLLIAQTGLDPALTGADRIADAFVYLFVQGKFYPLFSLLFGMGFAVMLMRADAAQQPFFMVYLCRVLALLAIGLAHALLVWSGDILVTYALVAFVLLLFFRSTPAAYLAAGGILAILFAEMLLMTLGALGQLAMQTPDMQEAVAGQRAEIAATLEAQRLAGTSESWSAAIAQRAEDLSNSLTSLMLWGWQILGLFLLGAWFVRSGAIARPEQFPRFYARLRGVALAAGMLMVGLSFLIEPTFDLVSLDLRSASALSLFNLGGTLMALGYLAWVVRGLQGGTPARLLSKLAPAGRMALTNYLLQSLVCTWIFSGYGLGYFERLPRAWQIPFVLAFFTLQVLASQAWLSRFRMGPMEWLWRAATYLRLPPMRR
ncbi:DUF418 domain-containing protein [Arenimonas terrae]|jgi:uncharacterized protein|uniref:DUF418 domain-containing protein n=1 Tax=Arenimonas terrae TaxID=2546226 RepID=A0A5C4RVC7_9GAMM|nr:DUF418 domain-containing protein [Arenimonas terrae]TNJ35206.1 DUF418 domain-containing protein [Arenimonas terrae]